MTRLVNFVSLSSYKLSVNRWQVSQIYLLFEIIYWLIWLCSSWTYRSHGAISSVCVSWHSSMLCFCSLIRLNIIIRIISLIWKLRITNSKFALCIFWKICLKFADSINISASEFFYQHSHRMWTPKGRNIEEANLLKNVKECLQRYVYLIFPVLFPFWAQIFFVSKACRTEAFMIIKGCRKDMGTTSHKCFHKWYSGQTISSYLLLWVCSHIPIVIQ